MGFVKFRHEYLYEHVNSENMPKLYDIVEKYLSNHLGTMGQWGDEWIIEGKLRGKIFKSLKSDRAVRFNWNIDATDNDINSIDIWENYGEKIKPIHRIELKNMSVTNGIQEIISYFNHPITESNSRVGIEDSESTDLLDISDEELDDITLDVFEEIKERVMQVAYGYANSLIITGGSGLGKTYEVTNTLNKTGKKYVFIKGDITTAGLYQLLFSRSDELIVFDDCDAVLKEVDPNILKAALDSYPEREVSRPIATYFDTKGMSMEDIMANYHGNRFAAKNKHLFKIKNKGKMPRTFKFTGRVIFISNLKQDQIDPNYITRATASIDVDLTHEEVLARLNKVMVNMKPGVPQHIKQEVIRLVDYLTMNYITRHPLNIRTVVNAISTRLSNDKRYVNLGGKKVPLWQVLIKQDLVGKKAKRRPKDEDVVNPEGAETIS